MFVGGVPAYSTLGKFRDPVLNTMLGYGDDELAAIIFHELSHQLVYVPGDSEFNEAFAVTVEQAGLERWLKRAGPRERSEPLQGAPRRGRHSSSRCSRERAASSRRSTRRSSRRSDARAQAGDLRAAR